MYELLHLLFFYITISILHNRFRSCRYQLCQNYIFPAIQMYRKNNKFKDPLSIYTKKRPGSFITPGRLVCLVCSWRNDYISATSMPDWNMLIFQITCKNKSCAVTHEPTHIVPEMGFCFGNNIISEK